MPDLVNLCKSLLNAKQYDRVIKYCDDHLDMSPKSGIAWYLKGVAYQGKKKTEKAEECFRKASAIDPREPANYYAMGILFYNGKRFEEALELFRASAMLEPKPEYMLMSALCSLALGREEEASASISAALKIDKTDAAKKMEHFVEDLYKDNRSIPEKEKNALKAQIRRLALN